MDRLDACQKRFRSETPKDSGQAPILMTPPVSYVIRVGILFAIYFATAKLGLRSVPGEAGPVSTGLVGPVTSKV